MNAPTSEESRSETRTSTVPAGSRKGFVVIAAFVSLGVGLLAVAWHWARESAAIKQRTATELGTIADLKLAQIVNWRAERLKDGQFFARAPFVAKDVQALLADASAEPTRTEVLKWLTLLKGGGRYEQIALFRPDGTELLSVADKSLPILAAEAKAALVAPEPVLTDLHRDADGAVHLNVLVPVLADEGKPIAAIVLRLDPRRFLFPLLQQWPLPSRTGEAVLARREGNEVVFLNELRHRTGAPLDLRLPADRNDLPVALAMQGTSGVIEGRDYRGEPVIAAVRAIPGSPWFLSVKVDRAELYAPLRAQAINAGLVAVTLSFGVLGLAAALWRHEEAKHLRHDLAAESALVETAKKYRHQVENSPVGIFVVDAKGRFVEANPAACQISGLSLEGLLQTTIFDLLAPDGLEEGMKVFQQTKESGRAYGEVRMRRGDEVRLVKVHGVKLSEDRLMGIGEDVTERRRNDEEARRWQRVFEVSQFGLAYADVSNLTYVAVNSTFAKQRGYTREEMAGLPVFEIYPPSEREKLKGWIEEIGRKGHLVFETVHQRKDGSCFPVLMEATVIKDAQGKPTFRVVYALDLTERKRTEEQVRRLSVAVEQNPASIVITDTHGVIEYVNPKFTELTGYTAEEAVGQTPRLLKSGEHDAEFYRKMWAEIRGGRTWRGDLLNRKRDGELYWESATISPIIDEAGKITHFVGIKEDITERKRTEAALRESQERFSELAENVAEVFWIIEPETNRVYYVSPAYERIWGRTCDSVYDDPQSWIEAIHPEDRERMGDNIHFQIKAGAFEETYRINRPDGTVRWIHDRAFPVRNAEGRVIRIVGVAQDVTDSRKLEAQFLQAQKMEAIGQLAGGVAHDFNNILSVITIHSDLLTAMMPEGDPMRESVAEVQQAAERAAALTRQLLVFSRQQVVESRILDLNAHVSDSERMLRRLIGEDVRLTTVLAPDLATVKIDPGHLGQVIMNLAVNARDAMPQGGQLTIETSMVEIDTAYTRTHADVRPGLYVLLTITDTGTGISPEVQSRIFEPFFTTKGAGHGTGLGLAVVHGIVKEAGGHLGIYSEIGTGTTFKIYLPAAAELPPAHSSFAKAQTASGTETILLVDDEESIRRVSATALGHLGYRVIEAHGGEDAIRLAATHHGQIDLLLTDVVMPIMGGRELADTLRERHPRLKVLFQSGYTDDAVVRHGILQAEVAFLQKPFTLAALAAKVREVLDR